MKNVLLAAMIMLAGASFNSCSKESSSDREYKQEQAYEDAILGKWKVVGERDAGNVYNLLYRLEGDYYITFNKDGTVFNEGNARSYGYYDEGNEFVSEDISDYLGVVKWSLMYDDVTGAHLNLYKAGATTPQHCDVTFNTDGTVWIWFTSINRKYYVLKKTQ